MSVLVTGTPGSGKTMLVAYAHSLGDTRFVDADELPRLCEWRKFDTNEVVGLVDEITITSNDDWYKQHGWYWREAWLRDYLTAHPAVILCGSAENIAGCYKLFDQIIIMQKTESDLLKNLQSPDRLNPFGKTTKQRAGFMEWQDYLISEAKPYKPIFVTGNEISHTYQTIIDTLGG